MSILNSLILKGFDVDFSLNDSYLKIACLKLLIHEGVLNRSIKKALKYFKFLNYFVRIDNSAILKCWKSLNLKILTEIWNELIFKAYKFLIIQFKIIKSLVFLISNFEIIYVLNFIFFNFESFSYVNQTVI